MILVLLLACSDPEPCEGVRDLGLSPAGLTLTRGEHEEGWGHEGCFQCHQAWIIHQDSCIEGVAVDAEAITWDSTEDCVACHGWNGVEAWEALDTGEAP